MVRARPLAIPVRGLDGDPGRNAGTGLHRHHFRQGAPLRRRRKRGASAQAIGRTKGGRNTKVYALSDEHCRPLAFYLTPGQTADIKGAVMLAGHLPRTRYLLADKAYDADHWRAWLLPFNRSFQTRKTENSLMPSTANDTRTETPSSACSGASRITGASPCDTTKTPTTSWPPYALQPSYVTGFE